MSTYSDKQEATYRLIALRKFINARPGFYSRNYATAADYRRDVRRAARDKHLALDIIARVLEEQPTMQELEAAWRHTSGRLNYNVHARDWSYDAGQYYCTEYRRAAVDMLAHLQAAMIEARPLQRRAA